MLNLQDNSINRAFSFKENLPKIALFKDISDLQDSITELQIAQLPLCSIEIGSLHVSKQLNKNSLTSNRFFAVFIYDAKDRNEIEQSLEKIVLFDNGMFLDDAVTLSLWANKLNLNKNFNTHYKVSEFKVSLDDLYPTFKNINNCLGDNYAFEGALIDNEFYIKCHYQGRMSLSA